MTRLIIAGSRDFNDYSTLSIIVKRFVDLKDLTIISGGARGADKLGEQFAKINNLKLEVYPADWYKWGKSAGYKRNVQMAEVADALVAFWDGESKGTGHMIDIAKNHNLDVYVYNYVLDKML